MAAEVLWSVLGAVVIGGVFLMLLLSHREVATTDRSGAAASVRAGTSRFYYWSRRRTASEALVLRQLEHHVRQEEMFAQQFVSDPNPRTLRAGAGEPEDR